MVLIDEHGREEMYFAMHNKNILLENEELGDCRPVVVKRGIFPRLRGRVLP